MDDRRHDDETARVERAADLVPSSLMVVALVALVVTKSALVLEVVTHPQGVAVVTGLVFVWFALGRALLPRFTPPVARLVVMTTFALTIVMLLVVPYFRVSTANDALPDDVPSAPLMTGALRGLAHDAIGSASVYQGADGRLSIGLEAIDIDSGPDLHVWLVPRADATTRARGIHLGTLDANRGTTYYEVAADDAPDLTKGATVLVWCRVFGFAVAHAPQVTL
ncbi:MAG TPA: DM13 domain-containing protein [Acidimicrobiia bacterium]|nr:DM13 domain-containing protein [Acidimicrobiia bacterium]